MKNTLDPYKKGAVRNMTVTQQTARPATKYVKELV
jgi:hypothetical protein